ncbi:ABC transporter ATP-binding protein [Sphingomonas colocasiae]|uniref:ABC transporter ATP-binding protein n=1 Tax=Sphingomonas colocasiae TaxID=1848973 RepID=A0ABS7PJ62_9SPHN|nr:ABC transporter ATP-binding protein [Sphingomonas colocasiae]MBY8820785.1 ABC transporter ATP-binding protein [Sphingomonas colocasiae]
MALTARSLSLSLGRRLVLDAISLSVRPGRITVLLGPNGAGKTSLLRCLAGLLRPESGAIMLDDAPIGTLPLRERARRIGYLPQSAELVWSLNARDVIALGRHPWRSPFAAPSEADRAAIADAMTATDTERFADRPANELSGGERARVLLARVLAGSPEWLLADEPLASLDPAHQIDILDRFRAAADRGCGVVIVLHDLNHAARIADDIALLHGGRLVAHGPAADTLTPAAIAEIFDLSVEILPAARGYPMQIVTCGRRNSAE